MSGQQAPGLDLAGPAGPQAGAAAGAAMPSSGWADLPEALRAEWVKLRTSPGNAWLLAGVAALTVSIGTAATAASHCPAGQSCPVDTTKLSLTGVQFGQAVVALFAAQSLTSEYSTGMIRSTFAALPRREAVLAAKAAIIGGLVLLSGCVAVLGSVLAGALILPGHGFTAARGFTPVSLTYGPTLRAAAGSVLYLALIAVLSVGVAAIIRDSAATIGAVLGLLYLFPIVTVFISNLTWQRRVERYSPMAGLDIQATTGLKTLVISPWAGLGVVAIWAVAALLAGGLLLRLRDA